MTQMSTAGNSALFIESSYVASNGKTNKEYLLTEQLREVEALEMLVSSLINLGMGYNEIKGFIAERYEGMQLLAG